MFKKYIFTIMSVAALCFWVSACGNSAEKGSKRQNGTNRNDTGTSGKTENQDIYEKNQEKFQSCQAGNVTSLLTVDGLAKSTLEGRNLELVLSHFTQQKGLQNAMNELEKSQKDLYLEVNNRLNLVIDLMSINDKLEPRKKFLFFESLTSAFLLIEDRVLTEDEAKSIAETVNQNKNVLFKNQKSVEDLIKLVSQVKSHQGDGADGSATLDTLNRDLNEMLKPFVSDSDEKIKAQNEKLKKIAERIQKKDPTLKAEYDSLSKELLEMSGALEPKACTQMIIEKTDKKGDVLINYLQSLKLLIDLESVKEVSPPKTDPTKTDPTRGKTRKS